MVNTLLKKPFIKGEKVIRQIEKHGFKAYFVGGCVRDLIIGRSIGDIDIATSATPKELQRIFQSVIPVGIEHGTVIVRWERDSFEITTFRLDDTYSDQRHPDNVQFVQTIEQDLKRRDFTMNAIAMDINGQTTDPYGGMQDIQRKQIRAVGHASDRFWEDPLRIVRAVRFSSQLGFSIEKNTLKDMLDVKNQIHSLAVERLLIEVTKLFAGNFINKGLAYLGEADIYNEFPVFKNHPEIKGVLPKCWTPLQSFGEVIMVLHTLYPVVSIAEWIEEWKASNKVKQEAQTLAQAFHYFESHGLNAWFAYILPASYVHKFIRVAHMVMDEPFLRPEDIERLQWRLPIQSKRDLQLNGSDLLHLFPYRKKGAWIGETLDKMEQAVVNGELTNSKHELRKWLLCHLPEEN